MNTIYKVIWNDALRVFQVVNEITRSRKRACSVKSVHLAGSEHKSSVFKSGLWVAGTSLMLLGSSVSWAANQPIDLPEGTIDLGGQASNQAIEMSTAVMPTGNEYFQLQLDDFNAPSTGNLASQDELSQVFNLVQWTAD